MSKNKTKHPLFQSSNTSTLLYDRLKTLQEQKKDKTEEIKKVDKELHLARQAQTKYQHDYNTSMWGVSIKAQKKAMTEKHILEQTVEKLDEDMTRIRSLIKRGGGGGNKRKSRKASKKYPLNIYIQ